MENVNGHHFEEILNNEEPNYRITMENMNKHYFDDITSNEELRIHENCLLIEKRYELETKLSLLYQKQKNLAIEYLSSMTSELILEETLHQAKTYAQQMTIEDHEILEDEWNNYCKI